MENFTIKNIYNIDEVHKYAEEILRREERYFNETMNPTKMNIIVPIIPKPTRDIMDLALVITGGSLNILLGLMILFNSSMHITTNCYITSLVCSNLMILVEPFQQVFRWIFGEYLRLNLDYVFLVTFSTSMLTIIQLNIETYVMICHKNSPLYKPLFTIATAIKGVLLIWIMCIVLTGTELKLYKHFDEEVMHDIYVFFTVMFLIFPCFIFVMLDCFILYDLTVSRSIEGTWLSKDIERFVLVGGITVGFLIFMTPYRVVRSITLITSLCCDDLTIEVVYTMVKAYPIILPVTCFAIWPKYRRMLRVMRRYRQREISETA